MSGALIDLVSKGVQDAYITGSPQVSFFRQNFKRHTNFSFRPYELNYVGKFAANSEVSIKIPVKGDLLSYVWIEGNDINIPSTDTDNSLSAENNTPTQFDLYIGGQLVDRQDSLFKSIVWPSAGYAETGVKADMSITNTGGSNDYLLEDFFPLHFFFCDSFKSCLPLIAMQYHEVEIRIKCRPGFDPANQPKVYANYIYLDTDERKYFVDADHEMLISQVQRLPVQTSNVDLSYFNHPVQAIHMISNNANTYANIFGNSTLYVNGNQLHENMSSVYSRAVTRYYHAKHTNHGYQSGTIHTRINTFPFTLSLSMYTPGGSVNFSRLDNAELKLSGYTPSGLDYIYAVNWNILRIKKGMAGVAFSN